jgi:uncharacterized protein (TIGR00730 family)
VSHIKKVCVYCGSSAKVDDIFFQTAERLGVLLAENGYELVYGGGRIGLMGTVASAVMSNGGKVTGIIPTHLADKEVAHSGLSELYVVGTMHERKKMMVDRSDAFIVMPGGLGTLDEFFEIMTWWQLGLHDMPILIVNVGGYWNKLMELIDSIVAHKFCSTSDRDHILFLDSVEDVAKALATAPKEKSDPKTKWI